MERQIMNDLAIPLPCRQTAPELSLVPPIMMTMVSTRDKSASTTWAWVEHHRLKLDKTLMERQMVTNLAIPLPCRQTGPDLPLGPPFMVTMVTVRDRSVSTTST